MNYVECLKTINRATGWSQEQLARELGVSFPALNAWINNRAQPRKKALARIEALYLEIVGMDDLDEKELKLAKNQAIELKINPKKFFSSNNNLDKITLYLTYHTNSIEGSTMTLSDVGDVVFDNLVLSNRTAIEQAEARNHQAALHWLIDQFLKTGKDFIIDEKLILELHLRLMNGIISDAGIYRKHSVRIMGTHVVLASWPKIPSFINQLEHRLSRNSTDTISELAKVHADFEKIHPFSDGNGRCGRLILLAQALKAGLMPPLVARQRKTAYYKYLQAAQTADNYKPLEFFVCQSMQFCNELFENPKNN